MIITKQEMYVRFIIASFLMLFLATGLIQGVIFVFLLAFTLGLIMTGVARKSYLKMQYARVIK